MIRVNGTSPPPYAGFSPGDAVADEDFERWYSPAPPRMDGGEPKPTLPMTKNSPEPEPDQIEDLTLRIFTHLHTMADRLDRTAFEAVTAPKEGREQYIKEKYYPKYHSAYPVRPFRKETNFSSEGIELPINANGVISKVIAILGNIFLGYENSYEDKRTPAQMEEELNEDILLWQGNGGLSFYYSEQFNRKMNNAFRLAKEILTDRKNCSAHAKTQRITFYVLLVLSALSKILSRSTMTMLFFIATSGYLTYMLTSYGRNSYRQGMLESDLKSSLETAEKDAKGHRQLIK